MNCTRFLPVMDAPRGVSCPLMPVDMAVRLCLASSPPLHSLLRNYDNGGGPRQGALRPCLSPGAPPKTSSDAAVSSRCGGGGGGREGAWPKRKKSVVFADSRGLALTAVHVYDEDEERRMAELQFHLQELEGATAELSLGEDKDTDCPPQLVLDFVQPAADYLDLRNRLKAQQVSLETCSLHELLLSGTVQVRNLCFDKTVSVRISYDSWASFLDVPCQYLNNVYGCPDTDTFSFSIQLPELLEPPRLVEFCLQYRTPELTYWDNNRGANYRLVAPSQAGGGPTATREWAESRGGRAERREEADFHFGSPRTSAGIFPGWQSWGHVESSAPYW